jgi:hypothetical protein
VKECGCNVTKSYWLLALKDALRLPSGLAAGDWLLATGKTLHV